MFPTARSQVYYNEAGEPIGWDAYPDGQSVEYCDICGYHHAGDCDDDGDED